MAAARKKVNVAVIKLTYYILSVYQGYQGRFISLSSLTVFEGVLMPNGSIDLKISALVSMSIKDTKENIFLLAVFRRL